MSQITSGLRAALSLPSVYDFVQNLVGARRARHALSAQYLRLQPHQWMVDVGCGTGEMLDALPEGVHYVGFDLSQRYIDSARTRYGDRARFERASSAWMSLRPAASIFPRSIWLSPSACCITSTITKCARCWKL